MKPYEAAASGSSSADMASGMNAYREERGSCLIEASALELRNGSHWQPWLRLTHRGGVASTSATFDRLKPVFGTEQAALRYAAELGRSLVDEALAPRSCIAQSKSRDAAAESRVGPVMRISLLRATLTATPFCFGVTCNSRS
jgi:hypothetical protein